MEKREGGTIVKNNFLCIDRYLDTYISIDYKEIKTASCER